MNIKRVSNVSIHICPGKRSYKYRQNKNRQRSRFSWTCLKKDLIKNVYFRDLLSSVVNVLSFSNVKVIFPLNIISVLSPRTSAASHLKTCASGSARGAATIPGKSPVLRASAAAPAARAAARACGHRARAAPCRVPRETGARLRRLRPQTPRAVRPWSAAPWASAARLGPGPDPDQDLDQNRTSPRAPRYWRPSAGTAPETWSR